jgi:hypothetical protein
MCLGVHVALGESRANAVEHRVIRGAERGRWIVFDNSGSGGESAVRGFEELS